jgi:tripartite-type tricarboxylate transporter receptor subunit TctC
MYSAALPHVKAGTFRVLATTDKVPAWPTVPTYREKGFPEAESLGSLQGFFGPANLPKPIQDQLATAVQKTLQAPSVKKALEDAGFTVIYLGPDALRKKVADDYQSIDRIVKSAKLGKYAK